MKLILCAVALVAESWAAADLFQLVRQNDLAAIRQAIANGADVNTRDRRGVTPLMHAAAFGSPEAMKILLDAGAHVNAKNAFDATALMYGMTDSSKVRMLLDRGAEVNARSRQGRTPLLIAAAQPGSSETVKLLLSKGADPKGSKDSPLTQAAIADDLENVRLLLDRGLDLHEGGEFGLAPVAAGAASLNLPAVKFLLSKGANVNTPSKFGGKVKNGDIALVKVTALHWAAPYASPELIRTLLDAGASVNAADGRGMTPLMFAVASEKQDVEVVKVLLSRGAEVNPKSNTGETALDWARKFNSPAMIATLVAAGAKEGAPFTPPRRTGPAAANARQSLDRSLALLQKSSTTFFTNGGCAGCHHTNFTAMAVAAARARGLAVDETAAREQQKTVKGFWTSFQELLLQGIDPPGMIDQAVFSLWGLAAEKYPADPITDSMVHYTASRQRPDGSWSLSGFNVPRAPMEEGDIQRTTMHVRALQVYAPPGRRSEIDRRVVRARSWLLEARPRTTDDRVMLLLGLKWSGADQARVKQAANQLTALQRGDGGWSQNMNLSSDAYATGEALWALHEAGAASPDDAVYQRGVKFLLSTQFPDGSWFVRSRSPKFQPYFESGFPFGHDQWISASATAWAAMALAPAAAAPAVATGSE